MAHVTLSGNRFEISILDHVAAFVARFTEWRSYRRTVVELSALNDRELADIGLVRSDIEAIARKEMFPFVR
ncbi:MAG: DUF1127 domain-containing protein [Pikeienuella sp.]